MATRTAWAFRGVLVAAAGGLMAVGIGFAAGGEGAPGLPASAPPTATVVSAARNSPSSSVSAATPAGSSVPVGPTAVATEPASVTTESQPAPATAASPRPAAEPAGPPPSAPPPPPPQVADLPRMTEKAVLALAAGVTMPSGKTFRECVELAPGGEPWPLAIHLYYADKGGWVIETHLSEVGLHFDEATEAFRVTSFNPPNPGCRV